jgi:hypothetical protein
MDEAVPLLHRPLAGALVNVSPFEEPHAPLTAGAAVVAEQEASPPPLTPEQTQYHGPLPPMEEAVPALHRPLAGVVEKAAPLALPQAPAISVRDFMVVTQ